MQDLCLAVIVLMPLLGSIVCGLRFYAKRRSAGGIGLDDWLIVAAVVCVVLVMNNTALVFSSDSHAQHH